MIWTVRFRLWPDIEAVQPSSAGDYTVAVSYWTERLEDPDWRHLPIRSGQGEYEKYIAPKYPRARRLVFRRVGQCKKR